MSESLSAASIEQYLSVQCPQLSYLDTIDSTNSYLKRETLSGAPHGSAAIANCQNAGRGRMGRNFQSPPGKGIYLSVLFRPKLKEDELLCITGMAAVAVCRAVQRTCGANADIKWINDLVLSGKKLAGILVENVIVGSEIALIIGVGINVHHTRADFSGDVADIATSLAMEGYSVSRAALTAAIIEELYTLGFDNIADPAAYLEEYRRRCITLGQDVRLIWTAEQQRAVTLGIDDRFGLMVRLENGTVTTVRSGEVSVRGLYGYVE